MNKLYKYGILLLSFLIVVFIIKGIFGLTLNSTLAKYSDNQVYKHYLKTKGIYFESSSLDDDYVVINNYNYQNIYFDIYNGNDSFISNTDVNYVISCSTDNSDYDCIIDNLDDSVDGTFDSILGCYNGDTIVDMDENTCNSNNYDWDYVINKERHRIKIINNGSNLVDVVNVNVEFNTSNTYDYNLSGTFVFNITNVVNSNVVNYSVSNDIGNMCYVKIDNLYSINKNVNVTLNNDYYFDNSRFDSNVTINNTSGNINDVDVLINRNSSIYLYYVSNGSCSSSDVNISVSADDPETSVSTPVSFATDDWDTIVNNLDSDVYQVGDTREIELDGFTNTESGSDGKYTIRIANKSTPSECSTSGFSQSACGFVIEFVDIITTHNMNSDMTNVGGWPASAMYTYLNPVSGNSSSGTIYNALPSELQSVIIDTTTVSGHGPSDSSNFTSTDKLFLLSAHEVWTDGSSNAVSSKDTAYSNTRQLEYYANNNVTTNNYSGAIKTLNGTANYWWLRSAISSYTRFFFIVGDNGDWNDDLSGALGVAPAFRIG